MKQYKSRDKITQKMTRDGLIEVNETQQTAERISKREQDADFQKSPEQQTTQDGTQLQGLPSQTSPLPHAPGAAPARDTATADRVMEQTLDLAQALYEKRLLTYPRTDSAFLTDDMGDTAAGIIKLLCGKFSFMAGKDFTPELGKVLNSKKVSDHHAIIPTMELVKTDIIALPESEKNILTLAGTRLLMATAAPHTFEAVTALFECAGQPFTARGKTVLSDGWKDLCSTCF
jgi:reverse gyrase